MTPTNTPIPQFEFPTISGRLGVFDRPRSVADLAPMPPVAPQAPEGPMPSMPTVAGEAVELPAGEGANVTGIFRTAAAEQLAAAPASRPRGADLEGLDLPPLGEAIVALPPLPSTHVGLPPVGGPIVHGTSLVLPDHPPAGIEARGHGPVEPQFASLATRPLTHLSHDELSMLIDRLSLRDTAREAFRARMVSWGSAQRHRSAYEIVFLMLAATVCVLLTGPTLIRVALALGGHPG